MNIEEIKKRHKDEWVLVEVLKEDEFNRPVEVEPLAHSKTRDKIHELLKTIENKKHVATFFTGKIPKKGYAVAFYGRN